MFCFSVFFWNALYMACRWEADCATTQCNFTAEVGGEKNNMRSLPLSRSTLHNWQANVYIIHSSENTASRLSVHECVRRNVDLFLRAHEPYVWHLAQCACIVLWCVHFGVLCVCVCFIWKISVGNWNKKMVNTLYVDIFYVLFSQNPSHVPEVAASSRKCLKSLWKIKEIL